MDDPRYIAHGGIDTILNAQWALIIIMSHGVITHGCRYHDKAHPMIVLNVRTVQHSSTVANMHSHAYHLCGDHVYAILCVCHKCATKWQHAHVFCSTRRWVTAYNASL